MSVRNPEQPQRVATTLRRDEAWTIDDWAHEKGVRRALLVRAMIRYVLQTRPEAFLEWFDEQYPTDAENPVEEAVDE